MVDVMNLKLIGLGCGMLWLGGSPVHANRIYWYALADNANQTENGMPMGGGFNFELGILFYCSKNEYEPRVS